MDRKSELNKLTTFDLAFNLATGKYNTEEEKFLVLDIIKGRDASASTSSDSTATKKVRPKKPPVKGSKSEMIQNLLNKKMSAKEVFDFMNNKKNKLKWKKTYYPEIYRIINNAQ